LEDFVLQVQSKYGNQQIRISAAEFQRQHNYKEKNQYKQYVGKRNKENGAAFESLLENACKKYLDDGEADIAKSHEPLRVIERLSDRTFKCVFTKKADPDFRGMLCSGRALGFEAKHTSTDRIEQAKVTMHQSDVLDRYQQMNARVFVVVSFNMEKFYSIPWDIWKNMKSHFGRKYVKAEEIEKYEIPLRGYEGKGAVLFLCNEPSQTERPRLGRKV